MRILNLIQCTNLGGMEHASLRLMQGLMRLGHSCELLSLNPLGDLAPLLKESGIPCEGVPYLGRGGWRSFPLVRERLKTVQADALLMTGHHLLGMLALGDSPRHRVLAIHYHHEGVKPDWQWRLIYSVARRKFHTITFPSQYVCDEAEARCSKLKGRTKVIRYPTPVFDRPTPERREVLRREIGLPIDAMIVGNGGWLIQRKRWDIFLETARVIHRQEPTVFFAIAGGGPMEEGLRVMAKSFGIADRICWLGWRQEMRSFYQAIDVLLFNSDWDALPLTPQEAMGCGLPVVASVLHGGLGEVIETGRSGVFMREHNVEALANAVVKLIRSREAWDALSRGAREQIRTISDPDTIAKSYECLLEPR